ncbi:MAG: hypothetical protein JWR05_3025 [Mucilaginibacter sp.]|nr:hypothetical protein [Mucilaginibacter sp.]
MQKNIRDIAPLLANHFVDDEVTPIPLYSAEVLKNNAERIGKYYQYLGLLHDSWILKTTLTAHFFSITLK